MSKIIVIFIFLCLSFSKSYAMKSKYLCKGDGNIVWLKFDKDKQLVITNKEKPHRYEIKDGIIYWHSLNQNFKDTIVVNSFLFQRSTGKLAIDSHSFVSGYNKKYYMLCDESY